MDNNIIKIDKLNVISILRLIGYRRMSIFITVFTILYFAVLAHKIPYVNFNCTSGKTGFILLGLSIFVIIDIITKSLLYLIKTGIETIKKNKRKENFNKLLKTLDAYSFAVLYSFYTQDTTEIYYVLPPERLVNYGVVTLCSCNRCRIKYETLEFLREFLQEGQFL